MLLWLVSNDKITRAFTNPGSTNNMKETQDLWPKGQRVKSSKCMGICAVGGKFKGCFVQQCVGILKSYIAYTVEPRWPQISVEVLDAEENDTVLPTVEHEGADDRWACLGFWGLWINTPTLLAYDITYRVLGGLNSQGTLTQQETASSFAHRRDGVWFVTGHP